MRKHSRVGAVAAIAGFAMSGFLVAAPTAQALPGIPNISQWSGNVAGVECVQEGVNNWARRTGHGTPLWVDGKFGSNTLTWVKKFQYASFGQSGVDGIVGPRTGNSLLDNLKGDDNGGINWRSRCIDYLPSTYNS